MIDPDAPKTGDRVVAKGAPGVVVRVLAFSGGDVVMPIYAVRADDGKLILATSDQITSAPAASR